MDGFETSFSLGLRLLPKQFGGEIGITAYLRCMNKNAARKYINPCLPMIRSIGAKDLPVGNHAVLEIGATKPFEIVVFG